MKKILLILSIIIQSSIFSNQSNAQPFQKTFGGINNDFGMSILQDTTNGGYTIAGFTNSFGGIRAYLLHIDANGDTLWTKGYGGSSPAYVYGNSLQQTFDGGYIIAGQKYITGQNVHYYAVRTDANGDTLWTKTYHNGTWPVASGYPRSVWQNSDSGFVFTGCVDAADPFRLIRTDADGDTLWTKSYGGGSGGERSHSVQQTTDGGFIISGYTYNFGAGDYDVYLVKTDGSGNIIWTKTYGTTGIEEGYWVQQTSDGGYIITGSTQTSLLTPGDVFLIKTNSLGDTLWTKTYGGTTNGEVGFSVQQTTDGGYIVTGYTYSFGAGGGDVYLIRTDLNGDTLWTKAYGGINNDLGYSVKQITNGGFIISGETNSFGAGGTDVYVISTDANGYSGGCNETRTNSIIGHPSFIIGSGGAILSSGATIYNVTINVNSPAFIDSVLCSPCNLSIIAEISTDITCNGFSDGTITITVSGGTGTIEYSIDSGTTFPDTTGVFTGLSPGIYNIVVRDSIGCIQTGSTITITQPSVLVITITASTNESCNGSNDGTATAGASGGTLPYSYLWDTTPAQNTQTATGLSAGNYIVTVTDSAGCNDTTSVAIAANSGPAITITPSSPNICEGDSVQLSASGANVYSWAPVTGLSDTTGTNVFASPVTNITYTVTGTDATGCSNTANVTVAVTPIPIITVNDTTICSGQPVTLTANGAATYVWSTGSINSSITISPTVTTTYTVTGTNSGCTGSFSGVVTVNPLPNLQVITTNALCNMNNGSATASGGTGYIWSNGQTTATAAGLAPGNYTVTITDINGCSASTNVTIGQTPGPSAGFSANPKQTNVNIYITFQDNSGGNIVSWQWDFGDGCTATDQNCVHQYADTGTYTVTLIVTDANGCIDSASDIIEIRDIFTLYIPNSFTPNGDGHNDFFYPQGINVDPNDFDMYIFDRWGNLMFHTNTWVSTYGATWNGTKNNSGTIDDLVMDVYVYRILIKAIQGSKHEYIGKVTLIR